MTTRERVVVGLSGGVDSAVAALLLVRAGFDVVGAFMKNWEEDDTAERCAAAEDYRAAHAVCDHLGIPLHAVNFSAEYWDRVFRYFLEEHRAGRTPNPDVLCNKEIKFRAFLEHAQTLGAGRIATGHYARVASRDGRWRLLKAADRQKDQTYFLYTLGRAQLSRTLFPIGHLTKPEVRTIAREAGLPNHARRDSTGICFIGERNYRAFLEHYLPAQPGPIRDTEGELKGRHDGLMYYTLGQRHGLGLGGPGAAWYVAGKDLASNTLYVAQGEDHPALYHLELEATDLHWVDAPPPDGTRLFAKTRYRQPEQPCRVEGVGETGYRVRFDVPQRALTPGQSVVFYDDEACLGGGVIARATDGAGTRVRAHAAC
ncbi:tRNA (5-methylaminomethyl-2-thiouridylate)-methyltransferase [Sulfurifustis variabilis]|uniref:tRNA-specific 2-thiouridylase MnmA n=1 Tax=Sulfurifustis variabilis TaxID=1675686 RepID=A0A1B4V5M8_9GAMM|nr:tRNA 2-thiouridine(34) synthase MnmA [Sulfurifustis variabilis]BAU48808.1 tRNA (5-methylaminomethyl-2-thiouridylate)-methyltransferase [Sulfurifustis variabilis]